MLKTERQIHIYQQYKNRMCDRKQESKIGSVAKYVLLLNVNEYLFLSPEPCKLQSVLGILKFEQSTAQNFVFQLVVPFRLAGHICTR